jgi:hypothetical protein
MWASGGMSVAAMVLIAFGVLALITTIPDGPGRCG